MKAHDLKYVICQYFNACGADPEAKVGEEHEPETHLIPLVLKTLMGQCSHFSILGTDYLTNDGTCVRDYIHVKDLADAHVRSLEHLNGGHYSTDINLGARKGYSVREIVHNLQRITQSEIVVKEEARRPGDAPALIADVQKSNDILGFKPQMGDLNTIITTAWNFHRQRS